MAGSQGTVKHLFPGDKAPFDGHLLDDEAVRDIDTDLLEKGICENKLKDCGSTVVSFGWEPFVIGVAVGVALYYLATERKDSMSLAHSHQKHTSLGIQLSL